MNTPTRRTVLKTVAWTMPVVAACSMAPMSAASGAHQPTCERPYKVMDPQAKDIPDSWRNDAAKIEILWTEDGTVVITVTFIKDYPNAAAINIDHEIVKKWNNGVKKGEKYTHVVTGCYIPSLIQVDGNNAHWHGSANNGQGGFQ